MNELYWGNKGLAALSAHELGKFKHLHVLWVNDNALTKLASAAAQACPVCVLVSPDLALKEGNVPS